MSGGSTPGVTESPLQKSQVNVAQQQWQAYSQKALPAISYWRNRAESNLGAKKQFAEGGADADTQNQFGAADQKLDTDLTSHGIDLGSGKGIFAQNSLSDSKAQALGLSKTDADAAIQQQYESGLGDIVSQGRGIQSTSDQGLATVADISGEQATQAAQLSEENAAGLGEAIGTGVGIGGGYGISSAMRGSPAPVPA